MRSEAFDMKVFDVVKRQEGNHINDFDGFRVEVVLIV